MAITFFLRNVRGTTPAPLWFSLNPSASKRRKSNGVFNSGGRPADFLIVGDIRDPNVEYARCPDGDAPAYVVKAISLEIGGKKVSIPIDAYSDFCDPPIYGRPYVMATKDRFSVFFNLSDGAGTCKVSLDFKDESYVGRTIHYRHR